MKKAWEAIPVISTYMMCKTPKHPRTWFSEAHVGVAAATAAALIVGKIHLFEKSRWIYWQPCYSTAFSNVESLSSIRCRVARCGLPRWGGEKGGKGVRSTWRPASCRANAKIVASRGIIGKNGKEEGEGREGMAGKNTMRPHSAKRYLTFPSNISAACFIFFFWG